VTSLALGAMLLLQASGTAQNGFSYRFRTEKASGTVWVLGDDARQEVDPGEDSPGGRVTIWKSSGQQLLQLDTGARTYYDERATLKDGEVTTSPTLGNLTARKPFAVAGVAKLVVDLKPEPEPDLSGPYPCRRVLVAFSYRLKLQLKNVGEVPGTVEASGELCLADSLPYSTLPFGHGLALVSGIREVDSALAERLAALKGLPVRRSLKATRTIEGGEAVSGTSTLVLSDFRSLPLSADRFAVPAEYRYQKPVLVAPVRSPR
jgi:hypothetical protein